MKKKKEQTDGRTDRRAGNPSYGRINEIFTASPQPLLEYGSKSRPDPLTSLMARKRFPKFPQFWRNKSGRHCESSAGAENRLSGGDEGGRGDRGGDGGGKGGGFLESGDSFWDSQRVD